MKTIRPRELHDIILKQIISGSGGLKNISQRISQKIANCFFFRRSSKLSFRERGVFAVDRSVSELGPKVRC